MSKENVMNRRDFVSASCLAAVPLIGAGCAQQRRHAAIGRKHCFELRHYEIESAEHKRAFNRFLDAAAIPAFNRAGVGPIGVFEMAEGESHDLWMLLPHDSLGSVVAANTKMLADAEYMEKGHDVLTTPKNEPAYKRFDSSLLLAFDHCPRLEVPTEADSRVFQLRIYESHNTVMAKRKIEMFNEGGEIAIFRETGLDPVFFGERIIGDKMPNLTYMLGFDDTDAMKTAWDKFRNHPDWKELRSREYYKDTVSHITNLVMQPTAVSQI